MIHVQCSLYICWFKSSKKTIYHIWCVTTRNQILCRVVYPLISLLPRMEGHVASSNSVVQHSAIGPCTPMPASQNRALTPRPLSLLEKCILPSVFYRGTRQNNILSSAALGKIKHSANVALPSAMHSAKPGSRQIWALPSAAALGKSLTRQKVAGRDGDNLPLDFAECLTDGTRQKKNYYF